MPPPPLSQSRQSLLACPWRYCQEQIHGLNQITGEAARRGIACHEFLRAYTQHLVKTKRTQDLDWCAEHLKGIEPSAIEILEGIYPEFRIDPEVVYATEQHITMDENFKVGTKKPAFEMTIDLIELHEETLAKITDYKSQFQAIDANTFQARLYSLGVFMLNPTIEQVEFQLKFIRWGKARSVTFMREQIPELQAEAKRWRERQISLHEADRQKFPIDALPGSHCVYCALLGDNCPVEANPYEGVESHLRKALYFKAAYQNSFEILKAHCDEGGPVKAPDGTGVIYEAAWGVSDRKKFGIEAVPVIAKWDKAKHDDVMSKLSLSGLGTPLRAKKRAELADEVANFTEVETRPRFRIGKAGSTENGSDEDES